MNGNFKLLMGHSSLGSLPVSPSAQWVHVYHTLSYNHTFPPSPAHCPTCSVRDIPEIASSLSLVPDVPILWASAHPSLLAAPGRGFGLSGWYQGIKVAHFWSHSTKEAQTGGSWVQGQFGLHSKTLYQNQPKETQTNGLWVLAQWYSNCLACARIWI